MNEFEKIYRAYFNDVFLFIKYLSKDDDLAQDITSETFFKAMKSLDTFRGDCHIRVWLCQIAKNCYFSYLKTQNKFLSQKEADDFLSIYQGEYQGDYETRRTSASCCQAQNSTPEEKLIQKEQSAKIHMLVHKLPEPYKEVFMLRVFGELSFKQIGEIFKKTSNWACVTYHRARTKIQEQMEENYE